MDTQAIMQVALAKIAATGNETAILALELAKQSTPLDTSGVISHLKQAHKVLGDRSTSVWALDERSREAIQDAQEKIVAAIALL